MTRTTPLGTLSISDEHDLRLVQPYVFYRGLPTSFRSDNVLRSVAISMLVCAAVLLVGLALVMLIPIAFVLRGVQAGVVVLICASIISSVIVPAGLGGIIMGIRFLRLPPTWRNPVKTT